MAMIHHDELRAELVEQRIRIDELRAFAAAVRQQCLEQRARCAELMANARRTRLHSRRDATIRRVSRAQISAVLAPPVLHPPLEPHG
jgi:hypothetical protein